MKIETLLSQAPERLRAYLSSDLIDPGRVGWRAEPSWCPVAQWLDDEQSRAEDQVLDLPSVWPEEIIFCGERMVTPPLLAYFINLIDTATMAQDEWFANDDRVTAQEALAALRKAERRAAQLQLPAPRCAYLDCQAPVVTPQLHGFLREEINAPIIRQACWPFAGGLCAEHVPHLIVPPATWWPVEFESRAHELREAVRV